MRLTVPALRIGVLLAAAQPLSLLARPDSALHPRGEAARLIAETWWIMLWGAVVLFLVVTALVLYAMFRDPQKRRRASARALIVGGGVVLPVVTLTALLAYGVGVGDALTRAVPVDVRIEVIGRQFWWEVRYPDAGVVTANEIRIPAGRNVGITLRSGDVIHSFWVPSLAGKIDLIPGQTNALRLNADAPGVYRGQCAEFCGTQHAHMAFHVVALEDAEYREWIARQSAPAVEPVSAASQRGRDAFLAQGCMQCHAIRGTAASGGVPGPDLTHLASRGHLAAGTLENTPENIARWISENERIKPGTTMPSYGALPAATVRDIAAYLGELK